MLSYQSTPIQKIHHAIFEDAGVTVMIKREDLNNAVVSGNKWWKLKYNLAETKRLGKDTVLTFGGAFSNHLYATAAAANAFGLRSIGIVRGEEVLPLNPTLAFAASCGMRLHYISRSEYKNKTDPSFHESLKERFGDFYLIPEGGTNALAVKGVAEFAHQLLKHPFDYLCAPVGTGGTLAGIIAAFNGERHITGFPALKGGQFLASEITSLLAEHSGKTFINWHLETDYHFGGYGKTPDELLNFLYAFERQNGFRLDPLYTGKMMAGIVDLVEKKKFKRGDLLLALHTGGLQGWNGITYRVKTTDV